MQGLLMASTIEKLKLEQSGSQRICEGVRLLESKRKKKDASQHL